MELSCRAQSSNAASSLRRAPKTDQFPFRLPPRRVGYLSVIARGYHGFALSSVNSAAARSSVELRIEEHKHFNWWTRPSLHRRHEGSPHWRWPAGDRFVLVPSGAHSISNNWARARHVPFTQDMPSNDRVCERHLSRLCHISAVVTFCQSTCRATADGADAFHPLRTKLDPAVYVLNIEQTYQYESLRDKWAISPAIGRIITTSWPSGAQLTFRHPRSNTTQQKWKKSNVSI